MARVAELATQLGGGGMVFRNRGQLELGVTGWRNWRLGSAGEEVLGEIG